MIALFFVIKVIIIGFPEVFKLAREQCWVCCRPQKICFCDDIVRIQTRSKIVVLSHPKESRRKTSTGRMLHHCLPNSEWINNENPDESALFRNLVLNSNRNTVLLFPTSLAVDITTLKSKPSFQLESLQVVVIDATWHQAKKMYQQSILLQNLPAVTFSCSETSNFKIRTQPKDVCLSSIESVYQVLLALDEYPASKLRTLLSPFDKMVQRQIDFQVKHHPNHDRKWERL